MAPPQTPTLLLLLVVVVVVAAAASREEADFSECPDYVVDGEVQPRQCVVHKAEVEHGEYIGISFTYTTDTAAPHASAQAFIRSSGGDDPVPGMDTHACRHTSCPVLPTKLNNYTYRGLRIGDGLGTDTYDIMWKLWAETKHTPKFECCLVVQVKGA